MVIRVPGYDRINPKTGKREHVDGYTRKGGGKGAIFALDKRGLAKPEKPAKTAVSPKMAQIAKNIKKRMSLIPNGVPTEHSPGWEMRFDRRDPDNPKLGMTDEAYTAWLANTTKKARAKLDEHGTTQDKYKKLEVYSKARTAQHEAVLEHFLAEAARIPKERRAVLTGGLPGSGKSSSLGEQKITEERYFTIDADKVKEEMLKQGMGVDIPGLTPFESAGLIHHESSDLAHELMHRLAIQGTNLVLDGTMANEKYIVEDIDFLHSLPEPYKIKGLFVQVTPLTSQRRAMARHREGVEEYLSTGRGFGGRFVDPNFSNTITRNRKVFEAMKQRFEGWTVYDNDEDNRRPKLLESSHDDLEFSRSEDGILRDANFYLSFIT